MLQALHCDLPELSRLLLIVLFCLDPRLSLGQAQPLGLEGASPMPIREIQNAATKVPFQEIQVAAEGTVTWSDPTEGSFFYIQDRTGGIRVAYETGTGPSVGDSVQVHGLLKLRAFAPVIADATFIKRNSGTLPSAKVASAGGLLNGAMSGELVEVDGWVRSAEMVTPTTLSAVLNSGSARITIRISNASKLRPDELIATHIRINGVASPVRARGTIRQLVEVQVLAARPDTLKAVWKRDGADPWTNPIVPLRDAFLYRPGQTRGDRIRVRGEVICQRDGIAFLNDGESGLTVRGKSVGTLRRGQTVEAVGFLDLEESLPILSDAQLKPAEAFSVRAQPRSVSAADLMGGLQHANYVHVTARLVDHMRTPEDVRQQGLKTLVLALQSTYGIFMAELTSDSYEFPNLDTGSVLKVSGVCILQTDAAGNPTGFKLLIPDAGHISVVEPASFFTVKRLLVLLCITLAVLLIVAVIAYVVARRNVGLRAEFRERRAIDAERVRLARDLHDTLEQGLTGIHLQLHSIGASPDDAPPATQQRLHTIRSLVEQCHLEIRNCIWNLRSAALEHFDLGQALERAARALVAGSGITVELRQKRTPKKIPSLLEDNLLRIGQEALTNAVKHSRATALVISLEVTATFVCLTIADNGSGMSDPEQPDGHFGLVGMRERAHRIGGVLEVTSLPGEGSAVRVRAPLAASRHAAPLSFAS